MKFIFLGTSAGTPTKNRNVTALAVQYEQSSRWDLFDCGEGTQYRILNSFLSVAKLNRVFITHLHGDHVYGLPGLLSSRSMLQDMPPLELFGPVGIRKWLQKTFRITQLHLTFDLHFHEIPNQGDSFSLKSMRVDVVPLDHTIQSFAYVINEDDKPGKFNPEKAKFLGVPPGPLYGKLKNGEDITLSDGKIVRGIDVVGTQQPGRTVIVGGDNAKPQLLSSYIKEADLFIHEATYTEETKKKIQIDLKHSTAKDVALASQKAGLKNLILTHFSPRFTNAKHNRSSLEEIRKEAEKYYEGKLFLAMDYDVYQLNRSKELHCIEEDSG